MANRAIRRASGDTNRRRRQALYGSILTLAAANLPLAAAGAQTTQGSQPQGTGKTYDLYGLTVTLPPALQAQAASPSARSLVSNAAAAPAASTTAPANLTLPKPAQQGPTLATGTVRAADGQPVTAGFVLLYIDQAGMGPVLLGSSQIGSDGRYTFSFGKDVVTPARQDAAGNVTVMLEPVDGVNPFGTTRRTLRLIDSAGRVTNSNSSSSNQQLKWQFVDNGAATGSTSMDLTTPVPASTPAGTKPAVASTGPTAKAAVAAAASAPGGADGCPLPSFPVYTGSKVSAGTGTTQVGLEEIDPNATYWSAGVTYNRADTSTFQTGVEVTGGTGFTVGGNQSLTKSTSNSVSGSYTAIGRANSATAIKQVTVNQRYRQPIGCEFVTIFGPGISNFHSADEYSDGEWLNTFDSQDYSSIWGNSSFSCPSQNRSAYAGIITMSAGSSEGFSSGWSISAGGGSFTGSGTVRIDNDKSRGTSYTFTNSKRNPATGQLASAGLCSFAGANILSPSFVGNIIAEP